MSDIPVAVERVYDHILYERHDAALLKDDDVGLALLARYTDELEAHAVSERMTLFTGKGCRLPSQIKIAIEGLGKTAIPADNYVMSRINHSLIQARELMRDPRAEEKFKS